MANQLHTASWLTARRIRIHGLLLAVCLWTVFGSDVATSGIRDRAGLMKGADFLHFYTLGTLANSGLGDLLYAMRAQGALMAAILPGSRGTFFVPLYGPQVSLLFGPFARLPYLWAWIAWLIVNVVIYAACVTAVWKACSNLTNHGLTVLTLAAAFPGFFHLLAWGQSSGLALLCFTLAFLALRADRPWLAGFAIGSLIFKPQLGLVAAVVFIFAAEWRAVLGAVAAAAAQLGLAWVHYGTTIMHNYFHALWHVREVLPWLEPRPYQMHSLRAFWSLLLPWPQVAFALYFASALLVLAFVVRYWRSAAPLPLRYAALLFATALVDPHLTVYDLVILAPAFLLLANALAVASPGRYQRFAGTLLYLCFPLFLLGPAAQVTHLQLSVPVIAGLLWMTPRLNQESRRYSLSPSIAS
jgi:hypothetical protein